MVGWRRPAILMKALTSQLTIMPMIYRPFNFNQLVGGEWMKFDDKTSLHSAFSKRGYWIQMSWFPALISSYFLQHYHYHVHHHRRHHHHRHHHWLVPIFSSIRKINTLLELVAWKTGRMNGWIRGSTAVIWKDETGQDKQFWDVPERTWRIVISCHQPSVTRQLFLGGFLNQYQMIGKSSCFKSALLTGICWVIYISECITWLFRLIIMGTIIVCVTTQLPMLLKCS